MKWLEIRELSSICFSLKWRIFCVKLFIVFLDCVLLHLTKKSIFLECFFFCSVYVRLIQITDHAFVLDVVVVRTVRWCCCSPNENLKCEIFLLQKWWSDYLSAVIIIIASFVFQILQSEIFFEILKKILVFFITYVI